MPTHMGIFFQLKRRYCIKKGNFSLNLCCGLNHYYYICEKIQKQLKVSEFKLKDKHKS